MQVGSGTKAVGKSPSLTSTGVVVHHDHHRDLLAGHPIVSDGTIGSNVVAAFEGEIIAVGPAALLEAAGKVVVQFEDVGNAWVGELPEIFCVGVSRKGTAGFTEGFGLVVAVGVDQAHALAGHVKGVLPLFLGGEIAIMAIGVGDTKAGCETARAGGV